MKTIFSKVILNKKYIVWLLIFMLAASVAEMMLPTMLASMIDKGIADSSRSFIFIIASLKGYLLRLLHLLGRQ